MSSVSKLGKGLTALLDTTQELEKAENIEVSIDLLNPNPWQPRTTFNDENLNELATSIRNQGIIQPLLVRQMPDKSYQVIAGERRLRAAKLVGLTTVPVFVRKMSDEDVMTAALIENLQREDLNPIEEALALKNLRDQLNITQDTLSAKIGRSRSSIANAIRLLQLSPAAQDDVRSGRLSAGHARSLLAISDSGVAESVRKYILLKNLTVRETEDMISTWKSTGSLPFDDIPESEDAENVSREAMPKEKNKKHAQQSDIAKKMQEIITQVLSCKAKVSGSEDKGKITISYSSAEELQHILLKLGASALKDEDIHADSESRDQDQSTKSESDEQEDEVIITEES